MEKHKACSFFGHRKICKNEKLRKSIKDCVEKLITEHNVQTFLFGSKSSFNDLCHSVVSELKEKYPNIKRVCYTCKNEACTLESERLDLERAYSRLLNKEVHLLGFEEEFEHKTKYQAGKASYIERNQAMIDDSDVCVFYCDKAYVPLSRTNSGTKIAYLYAARKNKTLINLF